MIKIYQKIYQIYLTSAQHKYFSVQAPKIWNDLLHHIRSIDSTVILNLNLKTCRFIINTLKSTSVYIMCIH